MVIIWAHLLQIWPEVLCGPAGSLPRVEIGPLWAGVHHEIDG